jgi:hypothetical protein
MEEMTMKMGRIACWLQMGKIRHDIFSGFVATTHRFEIP